MCIKNKKGQAKKTMHKTMNFGSTNCLIQKRSLGEYNKMLWYFYNTIISSYGGS